jgi:hypothetical protein
MKVKQNNHFFQATVLNLDAAHKNQIQIIVKNIKIK